MRPTSTNIGSNIPAFLSKLWNMVNDPDTDHLICWSPGGHSFIIQNEAQFWYNLLPIYYKHNNMSSFIRQLNMYGFHKIPSDSYGMDCDKDEIKFFHPFFQQDQPSLMKHIKRKMATSKTSTATNEENKLNNVDQITKVLVDVKQLRGRQVTVDSQLAAMKQENAALWRELALLRQKHMKQQQIVNKLIQFLVTIVQPSRSGLGGLGVKRRYPLMINDSRHSKVAKTESASDGPTIHELETESALTDTLLNEVTAESTKEDQPTDDSLNQSMIESESDLLDLPIEDTETLPEGSLNSDDMLLVSEQDLQDEELMNQEDTNVANLLNEADINIDATNELSVSKEVEFPDSITDKEILKVAGEYIDISDIKCPENTPDDSVFVDSKPMDVLNPDAMISSIVSPTISKDTEKDEKTSKKDLTVATRIADLNALKVNSADDLDNHLETTQGELESIKEMLFDGYSLDASSLLGNHYNNSFDAVPLQLFNPDEDFPLDLPPLTVPEDNQNKNNCDPMMSGSELTTYTNPPFVLDFDNLFEESSDADLKPVEKVDIKDIKDEQINTPIIIKKDPPVYPTVRRNNSK